MTEKTHTISEQEVEKIKRLLNGKLSIDEINTELKEVNALLEEIKTRQDPAEPLVLIKKYLQQDIENRPNGSWIGGYMHLVKEIDALNKPGGIERMKKKLAEGKP